MLALVRLVSRRGLGDAPCVAALKAVTPSSAVCFRGLGTTTVVTSAGKPPIGFIGLGNMGAHMARNLQKAG